MSKPTREQWLRDWVAGNDGRCLICNRGRPTVSPFECPEGCDLEGPYQRGSSLSAAQRLNNSVEPRRPSSAPIVRSLGDLLSDPRLCDPPEFVIPGLVEAGAVTILSGAPKAGKSTFASQIAAEFSCGGTMLDGERMGPGKVLWFALDEPLRRLVQRFAKLNADPDNFRVVARDGEVLTVERFEEIVHREAPDLIVIDTLSQMAADNGIRVNDAESVAPFLKRIVSAVQERANCGAILLFHTPHHAHRASGSAQWAAIPDATMVLRRPGARKTDQNSEESADESVEDEAEYGVRILSGTTRWEGDQRMNLCYKDGRYAIASAGEPLIKRLRSALAKLVAGPGRTSKSALAKLLKARDQRVSQCVDELVSLGEAVIVGSGNQAYVQLATPSDWPDEGVAAIV